MASYQTISFTVGHAPSRRYNTSRIQDIYLRFRLNNGIERVEFRHRGELVSNPEHVCWQPAIMDRGGGSYDAIFHYRSCSQPAALVIRIITQSDLKGEFVYNAKGGKSSEKQWVVLEKVLSWRQRWSVRSLTEDVSPTAPAEPDKLLSAKKLHKSYRKGKLEIPVLKFMV